MPCLLPDQDDDPDARMVTRSMLDVNGRIMIWRFFATIVYCEAFDRPDLMRRRSECEVDGEENDARGKGPETRHCRLPKLRRSIRLLGA